MRIIIIYNQALDFESSDMANSIPHSTASKQHNLDIFARNCLSIKNNNTSNEESLDNCSSINITSNTTKKLLESILLGQQDADNANNQVITSLRQNRNNNVIYNWFGVTKEITQSATSAAVIVYLKSLNKIKDGFVNGVFNIEGFKSFICNSNNLGNVCGVETFAKINGYLADIKYSEALSIIVFGSNYGIEASILSNSDGNYVMNKIKEFENNDIKNKQFRKSYSEKEIIQAKRMAEKYFTNTIKNKISQLQEDKKESIIGQIIYLNQMINVAARDLSHYAVGYSTLQCLAQNVFTELELNSVEEKIQFCNNLFLVNYHRHGGMSGQVTVKGTARVLWNLLPVISVTGMIITGIVALAISGPLGWLALAGAFIEGAGLLLNYNSRNDQVREFTNLGDAITANTNTYNHVKDALYTLLSSDAQDRVTKNIPSNKTIKERFCSKETASVEIGYRNQFILHRLSEGKSDSDDKYQRYRLGNSLPPRKHVIPA